ncbi:hypothetical protein AVEN_218948-1, partial [Araneus ventricosus]
AFQKLNRDDVTDEHRKIFSVVSYHFDLTEDEVENSALCSPDDPELLKNFEASKTSVLLFFH